MRRRNANFDACRDAMTSSPRLCSTSLGPSAPYKGTVGKSVVQDESIGVDVGGTKITALRVGFSGAVLARSRKDTPRGTEQDLVDAIAEMIGSVRSDRVTAVGVGLPGIVDAATGALAFVHCLGFQQAPLRALLEDAQDLPVLTANDANAAAWAEYRFGAARGYNHVVMVTVGTGLGCGIVIDGRLLRGAHGFAAEIAHLMIDPQGPVCGCGNRGCWGVMGSGTTIATLGREIAATHPESLLALMGKDAARITGETVTLAAQEGDKFAIDILAEVGRVLGKGLATLANIIDPTILVVGGGASSAGKLLVRPAQESFVTSVYRQPDRPEVPIVCAELGNDAGAIGVAMLAYEKFTPCHSHSDSGGEGMTSRDLNND